MIIDKQTNTLFLSDRLESEHPDFLQVFTALLREQGITPQRLSGTKDIWCRDYMPIQVNANKFVQFRYEPSYLDYKKYENKKTKGAEVFPMQGITPYDSKINLDGGNVISCGDCVIISEIIFSENKNIKTEELLTALEELFDVRVVVIPRAPYDFTGHADGAVRYYKDRTVLINDYSAAPEKKYKEYDLHLKMALRNAGFEYITVPCYSSIKNDNTSAYGYYINYLQMGDVVFLPSFDNKEQDEAALLMFKELFSQVIQVPSREIAAKGGVLNCISWTIKR